MASEYDDVTERCGGCDGRVCTCPPDALDRLNEASFDDLVTGADQRAPGHAVCEVDFDHVVRAKPSPAERLFAAHVELSSRGAR